MTEDLERRVAALERAILPPEPLEGARQRSQPRPEPTGRAEDDFWLLDELRTRHPDGAVTFAGTAYVGKGEVAWQWGRSTEQLREQDWEPAAGAFDALAHPVRLRLLQRVLNGTTATSELSLDAGLGTTGQLHHHLRALVAGGWLQSTGRGQWAVPASRVIPLLVVVCAAEAR